MEAGQLELRLRGACGGALLHLQLWAAPSLLALDVKVLLIQDVVRSVSGIWLKTGSRLCACVLTTRSSVDAPL